METKILMTYATKFGSTQNVAEVIVETLRTRGEAVEVDLMPMPSVGTLSYFLAVVLGAPRFSLLQGH